MSDAVNDKIREKLLANPDPTVQTHESKDRRTTRFSPKDLVEAGATLEAQTHRATRGMMRPVRMNRPE